VSFISRNAFTRDASSGGRARAPIDRIDAMRRYQTLLDLEYKDEESANDAVQIGKRRTRRVMRERSMLANILVLGFQFLLILAACSDLLSMTIPNWISALIILLFVIAAFVAPLPPAVVGMNFLCAVCVLAVTLFFFRFGWMGGGDAKLATATALWFGWSGLAGYCLVASVIGGGLAVAILALRRNPVPPVLFRLSFISRLANENIGLPYGIALAGGALLTLADAETVARLSSGP
jgi:prepilin peptidase CpaA